MRLVTPFRAACSGDSTDALVTGIRERTNPRLPGDEDAAEALTVARR